MSASNHLKLNMINALLKHQQQYLDLHPHLHLHSHPDLHLRLHPDLHLHLLLHMRLVHRVKISMEVCVGYVLQELFYLLMEQYVKSKVLFAYLGKFQ